MIDNLSSFNAWSWLAVALVLYILELLSFSGFFFWIGNAALLLWLLELFNGTLSLSSQFMLFCLFSIINAIIWRYFLKRQDNEQQSSTLNRRADSYIGRTVVLTEPVINNRGKITIDDSTWNVESTKDIPAGETVVVTDVNGTILHIKPHDQSD